MYMQEDHEIGDFKYGEPGTKRMNAGKDEFMSSLLDRLNQNHKELTRFEQYLLVKLKRGSQTPDQMQRAPRNTSLPKKFEVTPTSDTYVGTVGINSSEVNFAQPSFNSRNWSRTQTKNMYFESNSVKSALGDLELPVHTTAATKQTQYINKTESHHQNLLTSLTSESPKETMTMPTKYNTQLDRGGVRTSVGSRGIKLSEELSRGEKRNKSANHPHRKVAPLTVKKKPRAKIDADSLNDSEIEKVNGLLLGID